ncbi:MAG: HAD-IA family hydrolase [Pseudomonadota bacterium]
MKAVLFGSIGSIVETSELQRLSFNEAFAVHGLDWHWDRDEYISMLELSGGQSRLEAYARSKGQPIDTAAVHATKTRMFQRSLNTGTLQPRPGVAEIVSLARREGWLLGFISTTARRSLLNALEGAQSICADDFDLITADDLALRQKPDPAAYAYALEAFAVEPQGAIAIEDNPSGVHAAVNAGVPVIAFPGENTAHLDYSHADLFAVDSVYPVFEGLLAKRAA